jgi:hypothetical protein
MEKAAKRFSPLALGLLFTLVIGWLASQAAPEATVESVNTGQHFLPPYGNARERFGFDSGRGDPLTNYDVARLNAGWYSDWGASQNPAHPDKLVYVQLIRFTQGADPRDPSQVTVSPSKAVIAQIAAAHPGSLWFMSNEPDSEYQGNPILPEVYAVVYHDYYEYIKGLDPTALIANGGIVQPTPCRLEYLDIVWDTYLNTYGEPMPVDVWNIHAFILREVWMSWGASTPPGVDPSCALDYALDDADNIDIFLGNMRAMRAWMKDKGYQDKPLIVSEYGILWPLWFAPQFTPQRVSDFMVATFDLFLYETDPEIGYPADGNRLVQAWAWYSLSDDAQYNGYLFHSGSRAISPMGVAYGNYTAALTDVLRADLSARLIAAWPSFTSAITAPETATADPLTFTVSFTGSIGNLGKLPATDVLARFEIVSDKSGSAIFGLDAFYTVPARFDGVVLPPPLTATLSVPGRHDLRLSLDPEDHIDELREWNNVATATLDMRPDLSPVATVFQLLPPQAGSLGLTGTLVVTSTAYNQGDWPSMPVSATVYLETMPGGTAIVSESLTVPTMAVDSQVDLMGNVSWLLLDQDLYRLRVVLDEEDRLSEQNEGNNQQVLLVPMVVSATLVPTAATPLTSASGNVHLLFPAGVVTAPTEVYYTPWWPVGTVSGALNTSYVAFLLTTEREGQPISLTFGHPFSVTWRYGDEDLVGLEEAGLRLFVLETGGHWQDAACQPYQRDLVLNWLTATVCRTGQFLFGSRNDAYLPLAGADGGSLTLQQDLRLFVPEIHPPRSPLNLPPRLGPKTNDE